MNDVVMALGSVMFAISGATTLIVDYLSDENKSVNKLLNAAKNSRPPKKLEPADARETVKRNIRLQKMMALLFPWMIGLIISSIGFLLNKS